MYVTILILFIILLFIIIYCLKKRKQYNKIPGPTVYELIKLIISCKNHAEISDKLLSLNKKYGPVVNVTGWPLKPVIITSSAEFAEAILTVKDHLGKSDFYGFFDAYLGQGLATAMCLNTWRNDRKIIGQAMHQEFFAKILSKTNDYVDRTIVDVSLNPSKLVDVQHVFHDNFVKIIIEAISHQSIKINPKDISEYSSAREKLLNIGQARAFSPLMHNDFLWRFTENYRQTQIVGKILKQFPMDLINRHENIDESEKDHNVFIQVLLDSGMPKWRIADQINTIIEGGHDTTAATVSFGLYELSKHPDLQDKIYKETVEILGEDPMKEITMNDTQKMRYLDCVLKEILRHQSIFNHLQRKTGSDAVLEGYEIPKGSTIMIATNAIHTSDEYYKDADKFDPERFSPENENVLVECSYIPFSAGSRNCIGKLIGVQKVKIALAKMIRNFKIVPAEHEIELCLQPIRKSLNGIFVILNKRF